jgi:hypothetical protein
MRLDAAKKLNKAPVEDGGFNWHDPPAAMKKKLRAVIEKGLRTEYQQCLATVRSAIQNWENGRTEAGDAFKSVLDELKMQEKLIRRRYDLRGSQYCNIVLSQILSGAVTEADLDPLGEETKRRFLLRAGRYSLL